MSLTLRYSSQSWWAQSSQLLLSCCDTIMPCSRYFEQRINGVDLVVVGQGEGLGLAAGLFRILLQRGLYFGRVRKFVLEKKRTAPGSKGWRRPGILTRAACGSVGGVWLLALLRPDTACIAESVPAAQGAAGPSPLPRKKARQRELEFLRLKQLKDLDAENVAGKGFYQVG